MRVETTKPWDLYVLAGLTLLTGLVVLALPEASAIRVPLGLLFVLFAPGYALVAALFPERPIERTDPETGESSTKGIGGLERVALSLGMSIAVVPLLGLILNYTPWGIRLAPILLTLSLFTLAMLGLAHWRREKLPDMQRLQFKMDVEPPRWKEYTVLDKALTVGLALAVLAAGGALAYVATTPREGEAFTEFYILGPGGKAEGYPTKLAPGETGRVILGVTNHENTAREYLVRVILVEGQVTTNETGAEKFEPTGQQVLEEFRIALSDEQNLEENITFQAPAEPGRYRLEFHLLKAGGEEPYRKLHLWVEMER